MGFEAVHKKPRFVETSSHNQFEESMQKLFSQKIIKFENDEGSCGTEMTENNKNFDFGGLPQL